MAETQQLTEALHHWPLLKLKTIRSAIAKVNTTTSASGGRISRSSGKAVTGSRYSGPSSGGG